MRHNWNALFVTLTLSWLPWAFATALIVRLGERYPLSFKSPMGWLVHSVTLGSVSIATAGWVSAMETALNPWAREAPDSFLRLWNERAYSGIIQSILLYTGILATYYILESRDKLLRQENEKIHLREQLAQAQLTALRRQIEPHFLFNSLNSIAAYVREVKNDEAVKMIAALSDVLRAVIRDSNRQEVPLEEEVQLLMKYLEIQHIRFADRLRVQVEVPQGLLPALVPSFVLQPLVENAVRHGIAKKASGGLIRIAAVRNNGFLTMNVYNDGPSLAGEQTSRVEGIGLSNLRSRLQSLYGDNHRFRIENMGLGVEVSLSVPFQTHD